MCVPTAGNEWKLIGSCCNNSSKWLCKAKAWMWNLTCLSSLCVAARVWEEKERGGQESKSRQTAGVGHVVFCFWEASVLQHQRPGGHHETACGKTGGHHEWFAIKRKKSICTNWFQTTLTANIWFMFFFLLLFMFLLSDLLEGNLARYWRL